MIHSMPVMLERKVIYESDWVPKEEVLDILKITGASVGYLCWDYFMQSSSVYKRVLLRGYELLAEVILSIVEEKIQLGSTGGICDLCGNCNGGGVSVYLRRAYDTGDVGIISAVFTLFQPTDFTAFTAAEFYHYGDCGGREDFWTIG